LDARRIGEKLKELRGDRTLDEVSKSIGVSISALGMYETGQRIPRDEIKLKIADYYRVGVEKIFFANKHHET